MIYSPTRHEDEKWRLTLIEQMLDAFNNNCPRTAKEIGRMTRWLDERIKSHDYTEEDARHFRLYRADHPVHNSIVITKK